MRHHQAVARRTVHIHIQRLVLDGVGFTEPQARRVAKRVESAVEVELARLLERREIVPLRAPEIDAGVGPAAMGRQIAQHVAHAIAPRVSAVTVRRTS